MAFDNFRYSVPEHRWIGNERTAPGHREFVTADEAVDMLDELKSEGWRFSPCPDDPPLFRSNKRLAALLDSFETDAEESR